MLRSVTLGAVAVAALSSGCCWRPFCGGPGPALFNPPAAPLFPRLHPSFWASPPAGAVAGPGLPSGPMHSSGPSFPSGPMVPSGSGFPTGSDCPGCVGGGLPSGATPYGGGAMSYGAGAMPYGAGPLPAGGYPMPGGPATVSPPAGMLSNGPQFSPMYFGTPPASVAPSMPGSTQLPPPRAGEPPSVMQNR